MSDAISELLSSFGVGAKTIGITVPIISVLTIIVKAQPFTSLTSTKLERKLFTKEKRFSLILINFLFFSVLATFSSELLIYFYKGLYTAFSPGVVQIILAAFTLLTYIVLIDNLLFPKKSLNRFISSYLTRYERKIYIGVFFWFIFSLFSLIPSVLAGLEDVDFNSLSSFVSAFLLLFVFCLFFSLISIVFINESFSRFSQYEKEQFFIIDQSGSWYIYHAINKKQFLLGNNYKIEDASVFKILSLEEIMKGEIRKLKKPKRNLK